MKKILIIWLLFCSIFISCRNEDTTKTLNDDSIVLRYAESEKKGTTLADVSDYFANLVKEKSEGKIIIKVYYGGELGTEEQVLTQMQFGGIALGRVNLLAVSELVPSFISNFYNLLNMPFYNFLNYIDNNENYNFVFQNEKLYPLSILPSSMRCIYSDESLDYDDYSNLKIGIDNSEMYDAFLREWGANPVIIGNIATFPSLRNGFIDARESSISAFLSSDEYPYIKEVVILDNVTLPSFIIFSNEVLNQLSKKDVDLLVECANTTLEYAKKYIYQKDLAAIEKINEEKIVRRIK